MSALKPKPKRLPRWADEWSDAICGCGSWTVIVQPMYGPRPTVCGTSGFAVDVCPRAATPTEETT